MEKKITVILADANEAFRLSLQQALEGTGEFSVIGSVGDGGQAFALIRERSPALLVSELILPTLDGFGLIDRLTESGIMPRTVIVSALYHEQAIAQAAERGVAFFLPKPCELSSLIDRMRQAAGRTDAIPEEEYSLLEREVTKLLRDIGMPAHTVGYRFARTAIVLTAQDMTLIDSMTKRLYPAVARRFRTSPPRVERALRSAVSSVWDRGGDPQRLYRFFGRTVSDARGKLTNGEFIAMLADQIRLQHREKQG